MTDNVNHPAHYEAAHPGMECIDLTRRLSFCAGNAAKYAWRHRMKGHPVEDLDKAAWYARDAQAHAQPILPGGWASRRTVRRILRRLARDTQGAERDLWTAFADDDWTAVLDALALMRRTAA